VVLKIDAPGVAHKSDIGGVRVGLTGPAEVRAAATELLALPAGPNPGLLLEPMVGPGVELIVGLVRDDQYGPAVIVGLGGVLTEALDDTVLALAPISMADGMAMLERLRGATILNGVRGRRPINREAVATCLVALSNLGVVRPDIVEVDLNPIIADERGAIAVDALVVVTGAARPR
jgi:acyl-CoA synthetase (NDP forming)